jgi:hypothetical protein
MYKVSKIAIGLSMLAVGLWLVLASPVAQAKNDTGYLGMGDWRPTVTEPDDVC